MLFKGYVLVARAHGENVIIGAGSIVTHNIPDNVVAFGNPARVVQRVTDHIEKHLANLKIKPVHSRKDLTAGNGITREKKRIMTEELGEKIGYVA